MDESNIDDKVETAFKIIADICEECGNPNKIHMTAKGKHNPCPGTLMYQFDFDPMEFRHLVRARDHVTGHGIITHIDDVVFENNNIADAATIIIKKICSQFESTYGLQITKSAKTHFLRELVIYHARRVKV